MSVRVRLVQAAEAAGLDVKPAVGPVLMQSLKETGGELTWARINKI